VCGAGSARKYQCVEDHLAARIKEAIGLKAILNADFERRRISMKVIFGIALASMLVTTATAQDSPFRKELKRGARRIQSHR
jgi:hypothetical protein